MIISFKMSNDMKSLVENIQGIISKQSAIIGVCGLPGSGKTTLSQHLATCFDNATVVNSDNFCVLPTKVRKSFLSQALEAGDEARLRYLACPTHPSDNPYANPISWYDWQALAECLEKLKKGQSVTRPNAWNQQTGECDKTTLYQPFTSICIVDTIYLFEPALSGLIDYKVMIELEPELATSRERQRDAHRSDFQYLTYKKIVTEFYCQPYLEKYRKDMDFVMKIDA